MIDWAVDCLPGCSVVLVPVAGLATARPGPRLVVVVVVVSTKLFDAFVAEPTAIVGYIN